mgnify:CR=1 FL=1
MIHYIFALIIATVGLTGNNPIRPSQNKATLTVTVEEGDNADGYIYVMLWKTNAGFPGEVTEAWRNQKTKAQNGTASLTFSNLPYGKYAISTFHDEDNDGEVDKNWIGYPVESVGAYRHDSWGRPNFSKATLDLNQAQKTIHLTYIN